MNEVSFSGKELDLVNEFNDLKDKCSVSWGDKKFIHLRKKIKDFYLKEQDYTCVFCKQRIVVKNKRAWDAEHIIPRSTHPSFMFEPKNLCISCPDCNNEKRDKPVLDRKDRVKFPKKSSAYRIVHPHFDKYEEHLNVIVEGKLYQWITPKGRFTYLTYGLDRFMEDTGRITVGMDNNILKLMKSALADPHDYEKYEQEMFKELLLKYSPKIGNKRSINAIRRLHE